MPAFGARSLRSLSTAHPDLQRLFAAVVEHYDCTVTEGHREQAAQDAAFASGASRVRWPHGKHNSIPSRAVDVYPYPVNFKQRERFYHFAGFVQGMAAAMGISIRWGGDWDGDRDIYDQSFYDLPHFELDGEP